MSIRIFLKRNGGEKVQLVESLNDHPLWIACLKEIVLANYRMFDSSNLKINGHLDISQCSFFYS